MPVSTDDLLALLGLAETISCSCKKECLSNRCKCFKNSVFCTVLCKCTSCENDGNDAEKGILKRYKHPFRTLDLVYKYGSFVA